MEEPTIVESKRQKKIPPPRPPPPSLRKTQAESPQAGPIPRSQTVSGDMPRRPKHPPAYPARLGGSPVPEKKAAADPTPPLRRKKQQSIFPEDNPNVDVKEGFTNLKQDTTVMVSENINDRSAGETREARAFSMSNVRPSAKRKEAQQVAKMKVSVVSIPV